MAQGSRTTQRSPRVNPLAKISGEPDELAHAPGKSDTDSDEAPTLPEASSSPFVPPTSKDLFTKFMKVFMETT